MTPLARTLAVAALGTAALTAPVAAHAYVTPDQTGHGSGSFEVCTAPTGPAPWVYVVAARDPRIIRVPEDSWTFARTDGSWVRAKAADGRARVVTTVPLTGQVGDTIKVRKPGTDATTDLRLVAVKAPSCEPKPSPTPTGTPSPTPSVTPTPEETPWTPSPEPTGSAPAPTPSTTASVTPSQRPTTSAPSPTASCAGTGSASGCGERLASTGADTWPLLLGGLGLLGAGAVLTVRRPGRRH